MQALLNAMSVIAVAPITDFLLERGGENSSKITQYLVEVFAFFGYNLTLLAVFLFFGILNLVNGLTGVVTQYALLRIKYDVLIHLLTDTMGQFFRARYLFFSQGDMGKLLNSFQQEVNKVGDTFGHIAQLLANVLQVIIFLTVPFILSPKLTITFLMSVIFVSLPLWLLGGVTYRLGRKNTNTANLSAGVLHEILTSAKLILSFGQQENAISRYKKSIVNHSRASIKFQTLERSILYLFIPFGMIAASAALYLGYLRGESFSDMSMVLFAFFRLIPVLGQIIRGKTNIEGFIPAYEQIERLQKDASNLKEPRGNLIFNTFNEGIQLSNVSFKYPGRKHALKNINMVLKKGKMTAIVGRSGSGKTTLVDLVLGLFEQSSGDIFLDGKKLSHYDYISYRHQVGYVSQDPQLFNTTVRENLLWSYPNASDRDIWDACKLANAKLFVRELPEKLETILGDRGIRLSGGQRQRLALARAIIRKPKLLILDEATSSLDTESEQLIQESIELLASKMTIVVIAHRLSTIRNSDYVYVLDKGEIIEKGSYEELAKILNSRLSKMIAEQSI